MNIWPFLLHISSVCGLLWGTEVTLAEGLTEDTASLGQEETPQCAAQNLMTRLILPIVREGGTAALSTMLPSPPEITAFWRICSDLGFWLPVAGHSFPTNCTVMWADWLTFISTSLLLFQNTNNLNDVFLFLTLVIFFFVPRRKIFPLSRSSPNA